MLSSPFFFGHKATHVYTQRERDDTKTLGCCPIGQYQCYLSQPEISLFRRSQRVDAVRLKWPSQQAGQASREIEGDSLSISSRLFLFFFCHNQNKMYIRFNAICPFSGPFRPSPSIGQGDSAVKKSPNEIDLLLYTCTQRASQCRVVGQSCLVEAANVSRYALVTFGRRHT